jgi:hypothetical protein
MSYKVAQSGLDRLPSLLFRERWAVKGAEGTAKAATPLTAHLSRNTSMQAIKATFRSRQVGARSPPTASKNTVSHPVRYFERSPNAK